MSEKITNMDEFAQAMRERAARAFEHSYGMGLTTSASSAVEAAISVVPEHFKMVEVDRAEKGVGGKPVYYEDVRGVSGRLAHILIPKPAPEPKPEPDVREATIRRAATKFATAIERMEETGRALRAALDTDT